MYTSNPSVARHNGRFLSYLITAGAAGLLLSCSSPSADKAAGSQQQEPALPASTQEPTPTYAENSAPSAPAGEVPAQPSSELDPSTVVESAPPTPESTEAVLSLESRVTPLVNSVAGAKLVFIACDEAPCTLRTQASSLTALHQVLTTLSQEFVGNISFEAREQLDAYTGRSFQADVTLEVTEGARAVPVDENDLIATP